MTIVRVNLHYGGQSFKLLVGRNWLLTGPECLTQDGNFCLASHRIK